MRIGVYLGGWNLDRFGGMGVYLRELLGGLAALQSPAHQVILLADRRNRESAARLAAGLEVTWLDRPALDEFSKVERRRLARVRRLSYDSLEAAELRRRQRWSAASRAYLWGLDDAAAAARIDLLYFTIPPYVKRPRLPYVLTIHDLKHVHRPQDHDPRDLARRRRWGRVARAAMLTYSSYEHVRADVVRHLEVPAGQTAVLPLATPSDLLTLAAGPLPADLPPRFLLMPAQFWPHKNHEAVVRALALLRAGGIDAPVVCTGQTGGECAGQTRRIQHLAHALGVADLLHIAGTVDRPTLKALYQAARAVLAPTLYDPGSFPVYEALLLGRPLIASSVTSIPEIVGDAGLLFDPARPDELAAQVRRAWSDERLLLTLAQRGPARLPPRSWTDVAADWLRLCESARRSALSSLAAGAA